MPVVAGRLHRLAEEGFHFGKVGGILLILPDNLRSRPLLLLPCGFPLLLVDSLQLRDRASDFPGSEIPGGHFSPLAYLLHVVEAAALSSFPSHRFSVLLCYTPAAAPHCVELFTDQ